MVVVKPALQQSRGCLGCLTKPPVIISMDEPSKGQRTGKKDKRLEDLWSSSTLEMDQSAAQSQKSMSSIGISNQPSDPQSSGGATHILHPEFINHGLVLWHQIRQQWVESRMCESHTQIGEPRISWNASYESVLGSNKPFHHTVPLGEMVDFLVDIWEQEGLYE